MNALNENVLVIRRSLFDQLGSFQGLNFEPEKYLNTLLSRENNFFFLRAQAESDPTYKQIIPYVLLAFEDKVLYYVRGKEAGEQRLVAKGSIGIGGHLNDADAGLFNLDEEHYNRVVKREVHEEIHLLAKFENRVAALLNDDTTEVGRVHLGVVHVFKLAEPKVAKRERMITKLTFLTKAELMACRESLETWSQICVDSLERLLKRQGTTARLSFRVGDK
jgi:predicted NUDIX family phosphoesterase